MGRKKFLLFFFAIIFLIVPLFIPGFVFAHPGRTSSDGCHFCRTNCNSWGYTYNTRHGHSGQICDSSKGPIDPIYSGSSQAAPQESLITIPTATPTPRPRPTPTFTPKPTIAPTPTPTPTEEPKPTNEPTEELSPTPTEIPTPTLTPTSTPEVKGVTAQKRSFRWWMSTTLTTVMAFIFGWR